MALLSGIVGDNCTGQQAFKRKGIEIFLNKDIL